MAQAIAVEVDKLRHKKNVISGLGATRTLNANESGSVVLFDRAAGIVCTLPTAPAVGTHFDFIVTTSVTSNAYKIITGAGTELLIGAYTNVDTDTSNAVAVFSGNGSTHVAVNMAAASSNSTGGLAGTKLRFTCLSATRWEVEGVVLGAGTVATAFATS
jgi:Zn-dependent alcohol dehydrogenase